MIFYEFSLRKGFINPRVPVKVPQDLNRDFNFLALVFQNRWTPGAYLEQQARPHWNAHRGPAGHRFQSICGAERTECESYLYSTKILPSTRRRGKSWEDQAKGLGSGLSDRRLYQTGEVKSKEQAGPGNREISWVFKMLHGTLLNVLWQPGWEEHLGESGYTYMYG